MAIEIVCSRCSSRQQFPDERAGTTQRCSSCKTFLRLPAATHGPGEALDKARASIAKEDWPSAVTWLDVARSVEGYQRAPEALALSAQLLGKCARGALRGLWESGVLAGHNDAIEALAISAEGQRVVSASRDLTVREWDRESGKCLRVLREHGAVKAVAFAPDGVIITGDNDGKILIWNKGESPEIKIDSNQGGIVRLLAVPDGTHGLAACASGRIALFEYAFGRRFSAGGAHGDLEGHEQPVCGLSLTLDGRVAASAGGQDRTVRLWDVDERKCITVLPHPAPVWAVRLTHDGARLLSVGADGLRWWNVASRRCLRHEKGEAVSAVLFADERIAVTGSPDGVRIWDVTLGNCLQVLEGATTLDATRDGAWIAGAGSDRRIHIWRLDWELKAHPAADWDEGARSRVDALFRRYGAPTVAAMREAGIELAHAGFGWLREEGVEREMKAPPEPPGWHFDSYEVGTLGRWRMMRLVENNEIGPLYQALAGRKPPYRRGYLQLEDKRKFALTRGPERDLFISEQERLSQLDHPNLAAPIDFGAGWLAFEPLDHTLDMFLKAEPPDHNLALEICAQIAAGLAAGHAVVWSHANLTPSCIGIAGDELRMRIGGLWLGGLRAHARTEADPDEDRLVEGNPIWLAPEQISGEVADARSDVYALGLIFYACFAGRPPFDGTDTMSVMRGHVMERPPPLAGVDARLARLVMHMLAKPRGDRPSAAQVIAELDALR
jgi:WD40 repeat protein